MLVREAVHSSVLRDLDSSMALHVGKNRVLSLDILKHGNKSYKGIGNCKYAQIETYMVAKMGVFTFTTTNQNPLIVLV